MPYLMELDDAVKKIIRAIEARKKSYAFPWQLAASCAPPCSCRIPLYDRIVCQAFFPRVNGILDFGLAVLSRESAFKFSVASVNLKSKI